MHDGWPSVLAAYGITAGMLVVWFWMILAKLRRLDRRNSSDAGAAAKEQQRGG